MAQIDCQSLKQGLPQGSLSSLHRIGLDRNRWRKVCKLPNQFSNVEDLHTTCEWCQQLQEALNLRDNNEMGSFLPAPQMCEEL